MLIIPKWKIILLLQCAVFIFHPAYTRTIEKLKHPDTYSNHNIVEITLAVTDPEYDNPFSQVNIAAVFTPQNGSAIEVRGFCDDPNGAVFRIRFTPTQPVPHSYSITFQDDLGSEAFSGNFQVTTENDHGFIIAHPDYPTCFAFSNGGFPLICSKSALLIASIPRETYEIFIDKMVRDRLNCIRIGIEGVSYEPGFDGDCWPWSGTRDNPDYTRFDTDYWHYFEDILTYAANRGVFAECVVFCRKAPILGWAETKRYLDYILARLAAFPSIILFQTFNEYEYEYEYQTQMGRYIHERDPFGHLVAPSHTTTLDAAWPTDDWVDVAINHFCRGDGQDLEQKIYAIARTITGYGKPGWCDETGREFRHGNDDGVHRRKQYWTWNMGGAYWNYHTYDGNEGILYTDYNGPGYEYLPFIRPFWESTEFWKMQPDESTIKNDPVTNFEFCVSSENEMVIYMANQLTGSEVDQGVIKLDMPAGYFTAEFYNPSDGSWYTNYKEINIAGARNIDVTFPPFTDDLIIYLEKQDEVAIIEFSPSHCDFGRIQSGSTASTDIIIYNRGTRPLEVSDLQLSGTDTGDFSIIDSLTDFVIQSGDSQLVTIQFLPSSQDAKTAELTLTCNDPNQSVVTIPITGNLVIDQEFVENHFFGYKQYIPRPGPEFDLEANPGYLRLTIPSSAIYDHWTEMDFAPQLRRDLPGGDWNAETSIDLVTATEAQFHVGLLVYFSRYDLFYWGFNGSSQSLVLSRSGNGRLIDQAYSSGNSVDLKISKKGSTFTFYYRPFGGPNWIEAGSRTSSEVALETGLVAKTWSAMNLVTDFDYLRIVQTGEDIIPPIISDIQVNDISAKGAIISWRTNEPATSKVEYGLNSAYGQSTDEDNSLVTAHSKIIGQLLSNTIYHARVISTDMGGNTSVSADFTFKTLATDETIGFSDITNTSNTNGYSPLGYGHGVSIVDVDGNGHLDIFVSNSTGEFISPDLLYINQGNNTFLNEVKRRGAKDNSVTHTIANVDIDNDGDLDALFTNGPWNSEDPYGYNMLYRNRGDGYYEDITESAGMSPHRNASRGTALADFDRDGDMDIYIANWGEANEMYLNDGHGKMTRVHRGADGPEEDATVFGQQGVASGDVDNDGDTDIYVCRRQDGSLPAPNWLFINDGAGYFADEAAQRGADIDGRSHGATFGDIDNDGDLDLLVINFSLRGSKTLPLLNVLINDGNGSFTNHSQQVNIPVSGYSLVLGDIDNDADLDMLLGRNDVKESDARPELYLNDGNGNFSKKTDSGVEVPCVDIRSIAHGDIDSDGDIDFYMTCRYGQNFLLRNDLNNSNAYIQILCIGPMGDYGGYGTKVSVYQPGRLDNPAYLLGYQESTSTFGYACQNQTALHFGLKHYKTCDVRVVFVGGEVRDYIGVQANQILTVSGSSMIVPVELSEFTASLDNGEILLNWKTSSERRNAGFRVERRADNTGDWEEIGFVAGAGTSSYVHIYSFRDIPPVDKPVLFYRLIQTDTDGRTEVSPEAKIVLYTPTSFELKQNYPNPFNPSTTLVFSVPETATGEMSLIIYDVLGQKVRTLAHRPAHPGRHEIHWDGRGDDGRPVSSGIYIAVFSCGRFRANQKMIKLP